LGFDGAAVVRPPNNPYIADWVARQRRINGPATMIAKHNAARPMLSQLRSGKMLCMLVDQKLREGIAVPFFGRGRYDHARARGARTQDRRAVS